MMLPLLISILACISLIEAGLLYKREKKSFAILLLIVGISCGYFSYTLFTNQDTKNKPVQTGTQKSVQTFDTLFQKNILGNWKHVQGPVVFDEMSIKSDGTYTTSLEKKLFDEGTWKVENKVINLTSKTNTSLSSSYMLTEAYGSSIRWINTKLGITEVWTRN